MTPPPSFQIYLWPRVTLNFDLLTQRWPFHTLTRGHLASKPVHSFPNYRAHKFSNR